MSAKEALGEGALGMVQLGIVLMLVLLELPWDSIFTQPAVYKSGLNGGYPK